MAAKFEIFTDRAKKYRFHLKATNGEIIAAASEGYDTKVACIKGIKSIQKNAPTAAVIDLEEAAAKAAPVKARGKKGEAPDAAPKTQKPQAKKAPAAKK
jgi:uncharacterized protein YegP (UPF0339 family)